MEEQDKGVQHIVKVIVEDSEKVELISQGWRGSGYHHQHHY
jgi:hypothetical protein